MTSLYYYPASSSLSATIDNSDITQFWTGITSLVTSGSGYNANISGSDFIGTVAVATIYAYSGSTILATFPVETTNIFYYPFPDTFEPILTSSIAYTNLIWDFSLTDVTTPYLSGSACTIYDSSSAELYVNQNYYSNNGSLPIVAGDVYKLTVSGSGSYNAYLYLNNITSGSNIYSLSSSDAYISASFTPLQFNNYQVTFSVVGPVP
jgi:hypothetical protein